MARRRKSQAGVAMLETGAIMMLLLSILISGWAVVDLYQKGILLEELVEGGFYDGTVSTYHIDVDTLDGEVQVDRTGLLKFIGGRTEHIGAKLREEKLTETDYFVQGAVVEISWRSSGFPVVEKISQSTSSGALAISSRVRSQIDFQLRAAEFVERISRMNSLRERFIRINPWAPSVGGENAFSERLVLTGVSAVINVRGELGKLLLQKATGESVIVRTSFNVLRRDL